MDVYVILVYPDRDASVRKAHDDALVFGGFLPSKMMKLEPMLSESPLDAQLYVVKDAADMKGLSTVTRDMIEVQERLTGNEPGGNVAQAVNVKEL